MIDNKQVQKINRMLRKQIIQKFSVLAVALLVVGTVAYFGTHQNGSSSASSIGVLSVDPASASLVRGATVSVAVNMDSGTDPVNAVQASLTYDPQQLQYYSMSEGTAFPIAAATSTSTPGVIRVGRATTAGAPVTGSNRVVTIVFTVVGSSGTTSLSFEPSTSFIVRSTDNVNVLTSTTGATYSVKLPAPVINTVNPTSGPASGGTQITLTGPDIRSGASITIGGNPATDVSFIPSLPVVGGSSALTFTAPPHAAGPVTIIVTNTDGQSASRADAFTYVAPAPTVTSIAPASGPLGGGNTITITGTNFASGATVRMGAATVSGASVVYMGPTSLTVTVPSGSAPGVVGVSVVNPDGQTGSRDGAYTYTAPAPVVSAVSPVSGTTAGGTRITIAGANFVNGATVSVGGAAATGVVYGSATSISALVPARSAGAVTVAVTNPDGQSATKANAFTYVNPVPTVSTISPLTGFITGGSTVTITGTGFLPGATVTFGPTPAASVSYVSSTTLNVVTPVGTPGAKEVIVTNPDGQVTGGTTPLFMYLSNPGDANHDGRVNAIDLSILITHDAENYPPADFNGDGTVGSADLAVIIGRWTW